MQKNFCKKCQIFAVIFLIFSIVFIPFSTGVNIIDNSKTDDGTWEKIEYGKYPGQEPDGLGFYYFSANCSIGDYTSYITKEINLNGLYIATIGFSYYFGGHGTAIVNVYSGGYGSNFWEEAIFFYTSTSPEHIDDFESIIHPNLYSFPDEVYLEFYYFNDYGVSPPGFSIDDISIAEIGYFNSFETYNGTLSGYVTDPLMNPIDGALVRVYFHGTYEEDYSDSNGYYHVTNIPICYCMKNCTCSKEGYKTEWILMGIAENTTHDFVLYPLDVYPFLNGSKCNSCWNSPVTISFVYNPEIVAEIWYLYHEWHLYTEPFVVDDEGSVLIEYYWIDFEGTQSPYAQINLKIDYTSPITFLSWEAYKLNGKWWVRFTLTADDAISGMMPNVDIYLNDVLQETAIANWPTFEFNIQWQKIFKNMIFGFGCSDNACNYVIEKINGSDIKSSVQYQLNYNHNSLNLLFLKNFKHFPFSLLILKALFSK